MTVGSKVEVMVGVGGGASHDVSAIEVIIIRNIAGKKRKRELI